MFETAEELATKVVSAIYRWQLDSSSVTSGVIKPLVASDRRAAVRNGHNLWIPGSRLRVRFLDGPSELHQRVLRLAQIWSAYANISFEQSDDVDAEVRLSFNHDPGSWAYQATTCLEIEHTHPTVNLGWLQVDSPIDEAETAVLHEFGHVLGLLHERDHPDPAFSWKRETVYESLSGPPNFLSKQDIEHLIFTTWPRDHFPFTKPYDPRSIMHYPLPSEWTNEALSIERNMMISPGDREFVSRLYPYPDAATP